MRLTVQQAIERLDEYDQKLSRTIRFLHRRISNIEALFMALSTEQLTAAITKLSADAEVYIKKNQDSEPAAQAVIDAAVGMVTAVDEKIVSATNAA